MFGKIISMEFKTSWKVILIFIIVVIIFVSGIIAIYPSVRDTIFMGLEGAENIEMIVPDEVGGLIQISWSEDENASYYQVLGSNQSFMLNPELVYMGTSNSTTIPYDFEGNMYYIVLVFTEIADEPLFLGMTSTEQDDPFAEIMNNPMFSGLTGGRQISYWEIEGYIALELMTFWIFLLGMFMAYFAVHAVAGDFEGKRMDLLLSTSISRVQYVLEKFAFLLILTVLITLLAIGTLIGLIEYLGLSEEISGNTIFLTLIGSVPMLLVIEGVALIATLFFRNSKVGMGVGFAFVFVSFTLYTMSGFSADLEGLKYASVIKYWDYNSVLFDGVFLVGDFVLLSVVAGALLLVATAVFKLRDIPA